MSRNAAAMIEEPRKGRLHPSSPKPSDRATRPRSPDRSTMEIVSSHAEVGVTARRFTEKILGEVAETDADHVDDVVLVVSELITNAVREVAKLDPAQGDARPVHLGVAVHPAVDASVRGRYCPRPTQGHSQGPLAGSGRGIPIIRNLAAMAWVQQAGPSKTIHVVVTRTDVELTPREKLALTPLTGPCHDQPPAVLSRRHPVDVSVLSARGLTGTPPNR